MRSALSLSLLLLAACDLVPPDMGADAYDPDGDGVPWPEDCDSTNPVVYPGAPEIWYDGVDQDCGGDDDFDQDGDGYVPTVYQGQVTQGVAGTGGLPGGDCWDSLGEIPDEYQVVPESLSDAAGQALSWGQPSAAEVFPGAEDRWYDGVDQDCDGDDDFDRDGDGWRSAGYPDRDGVFGDDCIDGAELDDDNPASIPPELAHPEALETWYDGTDQDCDGNDCDADGDGLEADPESAGFCDQIDCDDQDPEVGGTGSVELWYDGVDQDCDGNDGDQDGDGYWASDYQQRVVASGGTPLPIPGGFEGDCWDVPESVDGIPTDFQAINGFEQPAAAEVHPAATDAWYDAVDQDCDGEDDFDQDGDGSATDALPDRDGLTGIDCDDLDPGIGPGELETWYDGVDQTCDGNDGDQDNDGFWAADYEAMVRASGGTPMSVPSGYEGDCDDFASTVFPSAPEYCDAVDSDCDGSIDDDDALDVSTFYADDDGDGYGDVSDSVIECLQPTGYVSDSGDCDDTNAAVNPGALEVCDGLDDDCDGLVDHLDPDVTDALAWYPDADEDAYGDSAAPGSVYCSGSEPSGWILDGSDCDDADGAQYPGADELCNGEDDDCDGTTDEDDALDVRTWYADSDGDGYGDPSSSDLDCDRPPGFVGDDTDCDDSNGSIHPGATEYAVDGVDSDCDGLELCYEDLDGDSYGSPTIVDSADLGCSAPGLATVDSDCDDSDAAVNPGAADAVADGLDSDCDGFESCYEDGDADGFGSTTVVASSSIDCSGGGVSVDDSDCDDGDAAVYPGAEESVADGVDSSCDGLELCYEDLDSDGYGTATTVSSSDLSCSSSSLASVDTDCDDGDASVHPGASEVVADGVDQDCSGDELCFLDDDSDGYGSSATVVSTDLLCDASGESSNDSDCDDSVAAVHPGATELVADGVDQDCSGDELCYLDGDGDGYGSGSTVSSADTSCADAGESSNDSDCDDGDATISPAAGERCDGLDNDCDGTVDEDDASDALTWYLDSDGDSWGEDGSTLVRCDQPSGFVPDGGDCDDADAGISPDATETVADGVDQDCDGGETCYGDDDLDGFGASATVSSADVDCDDTGESWLSTDCDDTDAGQYPGAGEYCNGEDDDCDGVVDEDDALDVSTWYLDGDGDGYGDAGFAAAACTAPSGYVAASVGTDCDDADASSYPGAPETCDGADDDCDGVVDEDDAVDASTWYLDVDADGYGQDGSTRAACEQPSGYSAGGGDCDDSVSTVNPGASEICNNGVDDDCDGLAEGCTPSGDIRLSDADALLLGESAADKAGTELCWAGDVDGDGLDDLLVGAKLSGAAGIYSGSAYLVLGPVSADASLAHAYAVVRGETYGDYAGASVAGAGDLDGDGYDDLLIGATGQDDGGGNAGAAYLLMGPISGELSLSAADVRFTGEDSGDQAGSSSSAAGDVDGDGFDDVIVGAFGSDLGGSNSGAAYLLRGPLSVDAGLSAADARLFGESAGDRAGSAVAGAGDVDGDGLDDLLVGAPDSNLGGTGSGAAYLVLGPVSGDLDLGAADARLLGVAPDAAGSSVAGAGDVNDDGYGDLLVGAPENSVGGLEAGAAYLVLGPFTGDLDLSSANARLLGAAGEQAGWDVAGGGDVDGDGYDDVLVGAPYYDDGSGDEGRSYLVLGPFSADVALSGADARLAGEAAGDLAGAAVGLGGDTNGDGYDDILVGASESDQAATAAGAVYLLLGGGL